MGVEQGNPPPYSAVPPGPTAGPPEYSSNVHQSQPQPVTTHHVIHASVPGIPVVIGRQMGPKPVYIVCKSCNHQIVSRVESKPSVRTHLFALLLCLVFWPVMCVPYCIDSCNNADHYCPNCNSYIGSYIN